MYSYMCIYTAIGHNIKSMVPSDNELVSKRHALSLHTSLKFSCIAVTVELSINLITDFQNHLHTPKLGVKIVFDRLENIFSESSHCPVILCSTIQFYKMNTTVMFLLVLCLAVNLQFVFSRPSDAFKNNALQSTNKCVSDPNVQEICQKCAKITKSTIAYPMCCNNEENGYNWCIDYVDFGKNDKIFP